MRIANGGSRVPGQYSELFRDTYQGFLSQAFETFREQFLRCSHRKGDQACFNTKNSHLKNHQARSGEVLSRGSFEAEANSESFGSNWITGIGRTIENVDRYLQDTSLGERTSIPRNHQAIMESFYGDHGPAERLMSHSTCLCCLANVPTNPLPCGHVLCLQCAQGFGTRRDNGLLEIRCCPLHPRETNWTEPISIKFKPQEAGVRVLCLERSVCSLTNPLPGSRSLVPLANKLQRRSAIHRPDCVAPGRGKGTRRNHSHPEVL